MSKKEWAVPDELKELMFDYQVGIKCRDKCIDSLFKAKRAIKYGKDAEKSRLKFWNMAKELHPEMKDIEVWYNFTDQVISDTKDA